MRLYPLDFLVLIFPLFMITMAIRLMLLNQKYIRLMLDNPEEDFTDTTAMILDSHQRLRHFAISIMIPILIGESLLIYLTNDRIHLASIFIGALIMVIAAWLMIQVANQFRQFLNNNTGSKS